MPKDEDGDGFIAGTSPRVMGLKGFSFGVTVVGYGGTHYSVFGYWGLLGLLGCRVFGIPGLTFKVLRG